MLYLLEIENFYSIRSRQTVDLRIGEGVGDEPGRFDALFPGSKERAARVIAFFGANASGKSNVLKALAFIGWFTRDSFRLAPNATLPCERFNDAKAQREPIRLAVEFSGPLDLMIEELNEDTLCGTWRYELAIGWDETRFIVAAESLKQRPGGRGKWVRVFDRKGDTIQGGKAFALAGYSKVIDKVRDNAGLISTLAQFDHKPSLRLRDAAQSIVANILVERNEVSDLDAIRFFVEHPASLAALNREIGRIDLGIRRMHIQQMVNGPMAYFDHEGLQQAMPWQLESHGTRNFIKYFPLIDLALQNGGVAVIDEMDISIHPLVLPEIVRWFHDEERNPKHAQLWMSCHAASLLDDLLKEEVFFCEKDRHGRTSVYGLQDIQDVRRTDNRYKKYLSGVYGSVPQIG